MRADLEMIMSNDAQSGCGTGFIPERTALDARRSYAGGADEPLPSVVPDW